MLDTLADEGSNRPVTWVHSTRSKRSYAFGDHVKALMKANNNWHAIVYNTDLDLEGDDTNYKLIGGRVDLQSLDRVQDLHLDDPATQYFICGPDSFMVELKDKLITLGATAENVKFERFGTGEFINEDIKDAPAPAESGCPFSQNQGTKTTDLRCPVTGAIDESLRDSDGEDL
ncbi:Flavohemoprotein [Dactylella cylindrospora]|nr:Flavohemoprotein [Dactylella cylindrospora]